MQQVRAQVIILDLDGPVLDGRLRHHRCYADILAVHGFEALDANTYWAMKRRRTSHLKQLAATGAEVLYDLFLAEWLERIERPEYLALDQVQDGARERLEAWARDGLPVVLATLRKDQAALRQQLDDLGLASLFTEVVICSHAEGGEGKANSVRRQRPGLDPAACIWLGDTEADAEAARAFGCPSWLLSCGLREEAFLAKLKPKFLSLNLSEVLVEPA